MMREFAICLFLLSCSVATDVRSGCDGSVRFLGEDDWHDILKGKWVVEFYANWCPACKAFMADWETLAKEFHAEGFCAASADVSDNADLSGRFFVTSLPTFYLIQDGEIRMYDGIRSKEALRAFVVEGAWKHTPVVPWYTSPTSYHMATLGTFFKFSMSLRNFHTHITENWGVPAWVSYIAFAVFTIIVGLLFGLFVVFLCDVGFGPATGVDRKKAVYPFIEDASIEDEDVVDDLLTQQQEEDEEEEEEEEEEEARGGEGREQNKEVVEEEEEEEDDEDEEDDSGGQQGESEADDEAEGTEGKLEEGGGEPRRRKKVPSHGGGVAGGDEEDEDDEDEEVVDGDVEKRK